MRAILGDERSKCFTSCYRVEISDRVCTSSLVDFDLSRFWEEAMAFGIEAIRVEMI
jgi:hypothetical protein